MREYEIRHRMSRSIGLSLLEIGCPLAAFEDLDQGTVGSAYGD